MRAIDELRATLRRYNEAYYTHGKPEVSDSVYDAAFRMLADMESEEKEIPADSPTQTVGAPGKGKVRIMNPMLSLDNAMNEEEVATMLQPMEGEELYLDAKLDGLAVRIVYRQGELYQAFTRSDDSWGEDVTANVKTMDTVPLSAPVALVDVEVTGEVVMPKAVFNELNLQSDKKFVNPRNAAAGSLRLKDTDEFIKRGLIFIPYGVTALNGTAIHSKISDDINWLVEYGFTRSAFAEIVKPSEVLNKFKILNDLRPDLPYDIDGMVVKTNLVSTRERLGFARRYPKWAFAAKFEPDAKPTKLLDVIYQTGRTGAITPKAKLEPVFVGGVTISSATLHNLDEVDRLGLHHGDTVIVSRAGDVIPSVDAVVPTERIQGAKPYTRPTRCPSCDSRLDTSKGVVVYCTGGQLCPAQRLRLITHFASKKSFNIPDLGPKLCKQLIEAELVTRPSDLFKLTVPMLTRIGITLYSAEKLVKAVASRKRVPLAKVLYAMGEPSIGQSNSEKLENKFKTYIGLLDAPVESFCTIEGIDTITAEAIYSALHNEANITLMTELLSHVELIEPVVSGDVLAGHVYVITGTIEGMTRGELTASLKALGARVSKSVSKKTTAVIAGTSPGSSLKEALALGVRVLERDELRSLLD